MIPPVRFSFFPRHYDQTTGVLERAIERAKLGKAEQLGPFGGSTNKVAVSLGWPR